MAFDDKGTLDRARRDLKQRLSVSENEILEESIEPVDFPDAALGATAEGEMSAQVITPGWRIRLKAHGQTYEYRASAGQLRLFNFHGENYRID
jgi:hypothetical protein